MPLNEIWQAVSQSFLKGIILTVLAFISAKAGAWLISAFRNILNARPEFGISGYWIGECWLPNYPAPSLEVWCYSVRRSYVKLTFFSYHPDRSDVSKWIGAGVFRGSKLSAYYFKPHRSSYTSGVIALKLHSGKLDGAYAQFDVETAKEPLYVSRGIRYEQRRVTPPFSSRVKMLFGIFPFSGYEEVKTLYEKVGGKIDAQARTTASRRAA